MAESVDMRTKCLAQICKTEINTLAHSVIIKRFISVKPY